MAPHGDDDSQTWESAISIVTTNLNKRLPCILVLDTSSSMAGEPIAELNAGLRALEDEFNPETGDPTAIRSVELAMVTFGQGGVQIVDLVTGQPHKNQGSPFVEAIDFRAPQLSTGELTPMGEAMDLALSLLAERKKQLTFQSIPYYRPWIFLISDGAPNPGSGWELAAQRSVQAEKSSQATVFPIGVQNADLQKLGQFSSRDALKLESVEKFRSLFVWMSNSLSAASTTDAEAKVAQLSGMEAWAQVPLSN